MKIVNMYVKRYVKMYNGGGNMALINRRDRKPQNKSKCKRNKYPSIVSWLSCKNKLSNAAMVQLIMAAQKLPLV
jgi:hypothetical protein